jgi:O-antigen ligase
MAANQRLRTWLIVGLAAGMPINMTLPMGGNNTNFVFADVFMPLGVLLLVWFSMKGLLRLPRVGLCLLSISSVSLSLLSNWEVYAQRGGMDAIVLEGGKVLCLWLYFYLFVNLIQKRSDFCLVLKVWIISSVAQALCGIYGSLVFQLRGTVTIFSNVFRAQGMLDDPNLFATHLSMSFFLTILYRKLTRPASHWTIAALLLQLAGIFFSASRGGMLALGASLTLLWLITTSMKQKVAGVAIGLGAAILVLSIPNVDALLGPNPITGRLTTTTINLDDHEARQRADLWNAALAGFLTAPVLGNGPGNFGIVAAGLGEEARGNDNFGTQYTIYVHNTLLEILCGTGTLGFASYVAFISAILFGTVRDSLFNRDRSLRVAASILLVVLAAILLNGLTISVNNYRGLWILWAIIVAHQRLYLTQTA